MIAIAERYRDICESSKTGWWSVDFTEEYVFVDEYLQTTFKFHSEKLSWNEFFKFIVPEDLPLVQQLFINFPQTNTFQLTMGMGSGEQSWQVKASLNRSDINGKGVKGSGSIRIKSGESKTTKAKLNNLNNEKQDLNELLTNIVNYTPMYLFVKDTTNDFRYVYSSPMMDTLYGRFIGDVIGKTDYDLFLDPNVAQAFRDKDLEILRSGKMQKFIEQMVDPQGKLRTIETVKLLVPRAGKAPYLLGLSWDISQQQAMETKLQEDNTLLSLACKASMIYPWIWFDNLATFTIVEHQQILHRTAIDTEFINSIHPNDQEHFKAEIEVFFLGNTQNIHIIFRSSFFAGTFTWYEMIGEAYESDKTGRCTKSVGIIRDITSTKHTEEVEKAKQLAEDNSRMKSAFLANMSHEIRTPLNAIVGFSNILVTTEDEDDKAEFAGIIEKNTNLLLQLINDILDLSKIEAGTMDFIYSDVNLNKLMREIEKSIQIRPHSKDVRIYYNGQQEECIFNTEQNRLTQVITNLLNNAIKFTSNGSITFGFKQEENMLYFYIKDTGCGIPQDKVESIFGRFVKLNSFKQGSGLGLSISKTIVEKMGGEVGVNSEEGKGSTFWFRLPYKNN